MLNMHSYDDSLAPAGNGFNPTNYRRINRDPANRQHNLTHSFV